MMYMVELDVKEKRVGAGTLRLEKKEEQGIQEPAKASTLIVPC